MTDPTTPNHDQPVEGSRSESYTGSRRRQPRRRSNGARRRRQRCRGEGQRRPRDPARRRRGLRRAGRPVVRQFSVKAAEVVATAADKAAPLAHKAGEATADASGKLAEKSRAAGRPRPRESLRQRCDATTDTSTQHEDGPADHRSEPRLRAYLYCAAMSVRPIVMLGDPRLRLKGKPVDSFGKYLHELLDDLAHTMRDAPGVGLAAPQLGEAVQACVIEVEDTLHELVNPRIVRATGDDRDLEGCLSLPGYVAYVTRREKVWVVAQDRHGKKIKVAGLRTARTSAPARARPPRGQALHRLSRVDGRAPAGRPQQRGRRRGPRGDERPARDGSARRRPRVRTVFIGSGGFGVASLWRLESHDDIDLVGVVIGSAASGRAQAGADADAGSTTRRTSSASSRS